MSGELCRNGKLSIGNECTPVNSGAGRVRGREKPH